MPARTRTALAGIVALAAALRFATLDVQSYWFDEAVTVQLLHHDLGGLLGAIPDSESTPPLYYVLAWFWSKLFGTGEVGLRSLSALIGTATVVVVYAVGARWVSRRAGLVAAALAAFNPLLIWYSQEARAYALLVLLAALTLVFLPDALERRGRLAAWAVVAALSLATHYFALFLVVPEAAWLLYRWRGRVLPALAAVGVAGIALAPLAVAQAGNDRASFIRESSLIDRMVGMAKDFLVGYDAPGEVPAAIAAGLLTLFGAWLLATRTTAGERRAGVALAALGGIAIAVPLVGALGGADYLLQRNLIAAWVPLGVALATGFAAQRARRAGIAAAAAFCAIGLTQYVGIETGDRYQRDDWRGIAEALGPARGPRAIVANPVNAGPALELYLPGTRDAPAGKPLAVSEIALVAVAPHVAGHARTPPRPPAVAPPPGFKPVVRKRSDSFTVVVYRSATPMPVPAAALYGLAIERPPALLFQPARLTR